MENNKVPWINNPEDILGIGLKNLLSYCYGNPTFHRAVETLNQKILFDFEDLYPISVHFHKPTIEIIPYAEENHILRLKMSLNTLIAIMKGNYTIVGAFFRGKIKVSQWWRLLSIVRLLKVLFPALQKAAERAEEYGK